MTFETRICQNCKTQFVIEPDDLSFYAKIKVPLPTFCPQCRKERRLAWRNDMNLYSRTCDMCGKRIVSLYSPDSGLKIYCVKCWWSDKWDPKSYAQDYDFNKPFFVQFQELQKKVPYLALINDDGITGGSLNCEYTTDFARGKNCYMVFIAWKLEDCMYDYYIIDGKNVVDSMFILDDNELIYESIFAGQCYRSKYIYYSVALSDCSFMYDCRDCSDCFMCVGLRHKRYCIKNEQYSKEEYERILAEFRLDTYSGIERAKKEFWPLVPLKPRRFAIFRNSVNSTGDYLTNCKNARDSFLVQKGEDCRYVELADTPKDSYDLSTGGELSLAYEGITPDHTYMGRFAIFSWKNREYHYLDGCHSSENVFGCVGMKKAQYCILNKQYSKEEYEKMLPKVIEHMNTMPYKDANAVEYRYGEFFPADLSYFGYNESVAQDHFPKTKEEARAKNFNWRENLPIMSGKETLELGKIPESITDIKDEILNEILMCTGCGRNYRIVPQELQFYRRMNLPLPRKCFFCRHKDRLDLRNPFKLYSRQCRCLSSKFKNSTEHFHGSQPCPNTFETSYAPDRPEIVYCEQCYQAEVA